MRTIAVVATMTTMVLLGSASARAQSSGTEFKSTVGGAVGGGKTWDDEGQIGTGLFAGAHVDRRLFGNTFAEASVDYLRHERTDRFSAEGRSILATGVVVQRLGRGAAQPYALGGLAVARHSGTFGFPEVNIVSSTESTSFGVAFGGGVAIRAGTRFEIGPEARFLILSSDTDSGPAYVNWIGVRFAVRF
jgi:hypothetical protein